MKPTTTPAEKLFSIHEKLATNAAMKLKSIRLNGYEYEDILQEMRIKLYMSILAYNNGDSTTPIEVYLKTSMYNYSNDFLRKMQREKEVFCENSLIDSFDYSKHCDENCIINTDKNVYKVGGVDLVHPLKGIQKAAFIMHLKGATIDEVKRVYVGSDENIIEVIKNHKKYLKRNREKFEPENKIEFFVSNYSEE